MIKQICNYISRYMGILVLLTAGLSLFSPSTFNWVKPTAISPLLGLVMFGMGLTLNPDDFKVVFTRPKDVIIGSIAQFTIMPGTAWLLTRIFNLPPDLALGVVLVGCCPGGTASNVITYLAGGDLALSVGITSVSTLLAPIVTPALTLLIAGAWVNVSALSMFLSIVQVVILPILLGFVVSHYFTRLTQRIVPYLPAFSSIMIALIVGIIVSANAAKLLTCGLLVIAVVALHNISGLALGLGIGRLLQLSRKKCVAISIEVGMQNSGLASSLATIHFAAFPLATIPGAVFSVWHNLSGALMAWIYATWLKRHQEEDLKC
jgi:bile acid:Na+ symporter, BASS family